MPRSSRCQMVAARTLRDLVALIAAGQGQSKAALATALERTPHTVQSYLHALQEDWGCPLRYVPGQGWTLTDSAWTLASALPMRQSRAPLADGVDTGYEGDLC